MDDMFNIPYDKIKIGDKAERKSFISEDIVTRFSDLMGDTNSFHVSDEAAAATVFKRRIAHGIHLAAFISGLIGQELPGFGAIYCSQFLSFRKAIYLGETITTQVEILEKLPDRKLRMLTRIRNQKGEIAVDGEGVIKTYR